MHPKGLVTNYQRMKPPHTEGGTPCRAVDLRPTGSTTDRPRPAGGVELWAGGQILRNLGMIFVRHNN